MAITEDVAFALQQQAAFYKAHQWTLRTDSFGKAHEETKTLSEGIRGKEILSRFHSLYQEPLAALVEKAVRVFAGIVCKLPGTSLKERTQIVEQHVQDCIVKQNTRKGIAERWLMQSSGWAGPPDVLIAVYEEKLESSWVAPKWLTPPPPNKAKKVGRKWFLQIRRERVPVNKEFAQRHNKKLDSVPEGSQPAT